MALRRSQRHWTASCTDATDEEELKNLEGRSEKADHKWDGKNHSKQRMRQWNRNQVKKTDIVQAKNNILVDDAVFNLDEWRMAGGIPIFFDTRGNNIDGFGVENKNYIKTRSLNILKRYE